MTRLLIALAMLLAYSTSSMAQVKVIISGGFSSAYRQVLPEFEKATGISVTTGSGASQGKGPQTIAAQLERGVYANRTCCSYAGYTRKSGDRLRGEQAKRATAGRQDVLSNSERRPAF